MIPELGHFALIVALIVTVLGAVLPIIGAQRGQASWMQVGIASAQAQFLCQSVAFGCLTYAFVAKDYSVLYVANNSNAELPLHFRISAVWGAHEGSLLLWSLILSAWTLAVAQLSKSLPLTFRARVLAVMSFIAVGFLAFMLFTSNPFERALPWAARIADLNPLLQDIGLIIHPPMLYMGYVGLVVPFSFAIAALLEGNIDAAWTRWTRPWTLMAWVFLTLGITLGSWWAYYELGWGGWWFWDPVENASFMPWLVATALIHTLAVTEKRASFRAWTILLAIFGFSLSLLGTFLVRSGVLVSVHSFASDPERGVFILAFLGVVIGGALTLYAWRATRLTGGGEFSLFSKEMFLLVNNVLLMVGMGAILLGTLFPLILDGLGLPKISVGPPYFALVFVPLMLPLVFLIGVGPFTSWKSDDGRAFLRRSWLMFAISGGLGVVCVALVSAPFSWLAALSIGIAIWVVFSVLRSLASRLRGRTHKWQAARRMSRSFVGMNMAHLGIAVFVLGVTGSSTWSEERDVRMAPGDTHSLGGYDFTFLGVQTKEGPNYRAIEGKVSVANEAATVELNPEKRFYRSQGSAMTEAAIDAGFARDLFVALGEPLGNDAWAVRLYFKPFQRWIWFGPVLMALGGLLAMSDRRYRVAKTADEAHDDVPIAAPGATA
ncbi:MAG: heme lyase CcmF/NrfE family subunit [Gammaproteobacteria bacterium]|nr:heme lyase CcmF/NrfE family subunit [Gammaproteobacteria bacterium]